MEETQNRNKNNIFILDTIINTHFDLDNTLPDIETPIIAQVDKIKIY